MPSLPADANSVHASLLGGAALSRAILRASAVTGLLSARRPPSTAREGAASRAVSGEAASAEADVGVASPVGNAPWQPIIRNIHIAAWSRSGLPSSPLVLVISGSFPGGPADLEEAA